MSQTTTARRNQEQALEAFIAAKAEIDTLLGQLQALSEDHFLAAPDSVHWGHVGSLAHARDQLREIARFLGAEG